MIIKILFICKNILHILNIFYLYLYPSKNINNTPNIKIQTILQNNNKNLYFYQKKLNANTLDNITNNNLEIVWPSPEIIIPIVTGSIIIIAIIIYIIYSGDAPKPPVSPKELISTQTRLINNDTIEHAITQNDDRLSRLPYLETPKIDSITFMSKEYFNNPTGETRISIINVNEIPDLDYSHLYEFIPTDYVGEFFVFFPQ
jgi:hypothetical protein